MAVTVVVKSSEPRPDGTHKVYVEIDGKVEAFRARDDADLNRQILALVDSRAASGITVGARTVEAPAPRREEPKSMDDLDREAFAGLVREYRSLAASVKAGVGKTTQADVDGKVAEIKAAYKDEYAPMLVGVF